jgi:hypothetical protein
MVEIKYAEKTNFGSLGRSGFTQCHGIAVTNLHPEVFLEAISSRGTISPVRIVVPLASIAALWDTLTAILAEPATIAEIGPDPALAAIHGAMKATFAEIGEAVSAAMIDVNGMAAALGGDGMIKAETQFEKGTIRVTDGRSYSSMALKGTISAEDITAALKPVPCKDRAI